MMGQSFKRGWPPPARRASSIRLRASVETIDCTGDAGTPPLAAVRSSWSARSAETQGQFESDDVIDQVRRALQNIRDAFF